MYIYKNQCFEFSSYMNYRFKGFFVFIKNLCHAIIYVYPYIRFNDNLCLKLVKLFRYSKQMFKNHLN